MNWQLWHFRKKEIAIYLVIIFSFFLHPLYAQEKLSDVSRELPEFSLRDVDDKIWDFEALKGKFWIINFWATWCSPCIEEIPSMNRAWKVLESHGIGMLAINAGEGRSVVEEFLAEIPIDFPTVLGSMDSLSNWTVRALPTTIVVDGEGKIVLEALGPREWDDEALLQKVINLR